MEILNDKICLIYDEDLISVCDRLPAVPQRASLVAGLLLAYNLHKGKNITLVKSTPATCEELNTFHSEDYLTHLKTITDIGEDYTPTKEDEGYGLSYDCPPVQNMYEFVSTIAGGTLTAAKCLMYANARVAINWCGGWHHAKTLTAEGFCYVNDIVIAIKLLKKKYKRVLYIDLDVHHGDAVEEAFEDSKTVMTLSYHKWEPGFYPGTGSLEDIGKLEGRGYVVNFPLKEAYSDKTLKYAFDNTFPLVNKRFDPDMLIVQCGADCLAHDPCGGAAVTLEGYMHCILKILKKTKPTLLIGGGGYNLTNASRLWTSITAAAIGQELDGFIPDHNYIDKYGPSYHLDINSSLVKDANSKLYLDKCIQIISNNLNYVNL